MTKKRILVIIFSIVSMFAISLLSVVRGSSAVAENPAEERSVAVDGSEFTLDSSACISTPSDKIVNGGAASANTTSGYDKPAKLYVNNFKRGFACYLDFNGIDVSGYGGIVIEWAKNINAKTTLYFYKNGDDINGEPVDMYTSGEGIYEDKTIDGIVSEPRTTFTAVLPLKSFADANGQVSGIVIKHESDERTEEFDGFAMRIYSIRLGDFFGDYELNPDGKDFTVSAVGGYQSSNVGVSVSTGKIYCNKFSRGKAIKIELPQSVNSTIYKTLTLKISLFLDGNTMNNFYLGVACGNESDVSLPIPAGGKSIRSTNDKTSAAMVEFSVPTESLRSDGNVISSLILYHYDDDRADDTEALNLFIWGLSVSVTETAYDNDYMADVVTAAIIRSEDSYTVILKFDRNLFRKSEEISADKAMFADMLTVNGKAAENEYLQKALVGYENLTDSLAIVFRKGYIDYSFNGNLRINAEVFEIKGNASLRVGLKTAVEFVIKSDTAENALTALRRNGCKVLSVSAESTDGFTSYAIRFDCVPGTYADDICDFIEINGIKLSEIEAKEIFSRDNEIVVKLKNQNLSPEKNEIKILSGLSTENMFIGEERIFCHYALNDEYAYPCDEDLTVLWFEKTNYTDEYLHFVVKVSRTSAEAADISESAILKKVFINGKSLYDRVFSGVSVIAEGDFVTFTVPVSFVNLNKNENDVIVFEKGFALPASGVTGYSKSFRFSKLWHNYEVVPDTSMAQNRGQSVSISLIEISSDTTADKLSLHIEFSLPVSYRYYDIMQQEPKEIAKRMEGVSTSNPSDLFIADLAYYGVLDSCLNNIKYDGKTIYEWFEAIKIPGEKWYEKINVAYLGNNLFNAAAKRLSLSISLGKDLISLNDEHTLEFGEGLITPMLQTLHSTYSFKWDPSALRWYSVSSPSLPESNDADASASTKIIVITTVAAGTVAIAAAVVTIVVIKRKKRRKEV